MSPVSDIFYAWPVCITSVTKQCSVQQCGGPGVRPGDLGEFSSAGSKDSAVCGDNPANMANTGSTKMECAGRN